MAQEKTPYAVFVEMLRHPSAKPLVNRTRNFVGSFPDGLSRYDAADRVHNYLSEMERFMFSDCVVFEAEADEQGILNASEGLEKLVICKLYTKVFGTFDSDQEDDVTLKTHIDGLSWVTLEHLGIPEIEVSLWPRVIEELRQMDAYKSPCDKLTCVVNTCHVINDVLKRTQAELGTSRPLSADDFLPLLIYAIIKANPPRLHSNAEFVAAFRHPSRLNGEFAYWITMLCSAKEFVKQVTSTNGLDVSPEEYARLYAISLEAASPKDASSGYPTSDAIVPTDTEEKVKEAPTEVSSAPVDGSELQLLAKQEVVVYQIPAASSSDGHKANDWKTIIWKGSCVVIGQDKDLVIKMLDRSSGNLFAECLVPGDEHDKYIEPVVDSKQHYALKIRNGEKQALIGLGFEDVGGASAFNHVLQDFKSAAADRRFQAYFSESSSTSQSPAESPSEAIIPDESDPFGFQDAPSALLPSPSTLTSSSQEPPRESDPFAGLEGSPTATSTDSSPDMLLHHSDMLTTGASQTPVQTHGTVPQACASELADPFAEFVDMMTVPAIA